MIFKAAASAASASSHRSAAGSSSLLENADTDKKAPIQYVLLASTIPTTIPTRIHCVNETRCRLAYCTNAWHNNLLTIHYGMVYVYYIDAAALCALNAVKKYSLLRT